MVRYRTQKVDIDVAVTKQTMDGLKVWFAEHVFDQSIRNVFFRQQRYV